MFPRVPDFNRLLNDQCDLTVRAMVALEAYMGTGVPLEKSQPAGSRENITSAFLRPMLV